MLHAALQCLIKNMCVCLHAVLLTLCISKSAIKIVKLSVVSFALLVILATCCVEKYACNKWISLDLLHLDISTCPVSHVGVNKLNQDMDAVIVWTLTVSLLCFVPHSGAPPPHGPVQTSSSTGSGERAHPSH